MQEIQVKGLTFASVTGALDEMRGTDFKKRVLDAMPSESGDALRLGSVIASGWYPVRYYRELFEAAVDIAGDKFFPREIGRVSFRRELRGVHRLLFKVLSPETLQRVSSRFFGSYFRPTQVRVVRLSTTVGLVHYSDCHGFDENLWQEQVGCIEEMLVQCGLKTPRVRILRGGGDGDHATDVELTWR